MAVDGFLTWGTNIIIGNRIRREKIISIWKWLSACGSATGLTTVNVFIILLQFVWLCLQVSLNRNRNYIPVRLQQCEIIAVSFNYSQSWKSNWKSFPKEITKKRVICSPASISSISCWKQRRCSSELHIGCSYLFARIYFQQCFFITNLIILMWY